MPSLVLVLLFAQPPALELGEISPKGHADLTAKVDQMFARWNQPDVPGCAVGIRHHGQVVYSKGLGSANLDYETPNTPRTLFELASASKAFTCACLAILMDQGKVLPDDDVRKYVPELHAFDPPIRIRHLVRCRTGLWDQFHIMPLAGWDNLPVQSPYSEADLLTVLSGQKRLPFEPGTQFHYGSGDSFVLGLVVKRASGQSLAEFARTNIFGPLGMAHTFFEEDPTRVAKHRAVGHLQDGGAWRQWRVNAYLGGGCGVKTCLEDLFRWDGNFDDNRLPRGKHMDEFIREGTLLGNREVLDADAYRRESQPMVPNPPAGQYRGLKRIQFTGGVWGMTAAMARFPEQKFTVICLSNNSDISPFTKTKEIADLYLADVLAPLPDATPADEPKEFVKLTAGELKSKTGAYRLLGEERIWKVAVKAGELHVIDPLHNAWRLRPQSATRFRPEEKSPFYKSARFHFKRNEPDGPYSMTLESNEYGFREVLEFRRVELVAPSLEALSGYAGEYQSDELPVSYRFSVKDGALWLRAGSRRWERLDPTVRDEFIPHVRTVHDNRIIRFRRDDSQRIAGFSIAFWRVTGVDFKKQPVKRG